MLCHRVTELLQPLDRQELGEMLCEPVFISKGGDADKRQMCAYCLLMAYLAPIQIMTKNSHQKKANYGWFFFF